MSQYCPVVSHKSSAFFASRILYRERAARSFGGARTALLRVLEDAIDLRLKRIYHKTEMQPAQRGINRKQTFDLSTSS